MNLWKLWFHNLLTAAIGGASAAGAVIMVDPQTFNFSGAGLVALGKVAGAGALLAVINYLRRSPLPNMVSEVPVASQSPVVVVVEPKVMNVTEAPKELA